MRALPLRLRLTLWHGLLTGAAFTAVFVLVYVLARDRLVRHHDEDLAATAQEVQHILERHEDCAELSAEQVAAIDRLGKIVVVHVMSGRPMLLHASPGGEILSPMTELPPVGSRPPRGATASPSFVTLATPSGLVRECSLPYRSRAGRPGVIRVAGRLGDIVEPLHALLWTLVGCAPVALLLALAAGHWLAGRALAPVDRVTQLAREIGTSSLSRRLPEPPLADEIGRLVHVFNEMIGRLESSFAALERFTADAAHELRTPLATMRATLDLALERPRSHDEYRDALAEVADEVDRLRSVADDLLLLARTDAGHVPLRSRPLDVGIVAERVAEAFRPLAAERGVTLEVRAPGPVLVRGDARWLRQLLVNLLDNAVRAAAGASGGRVEVEAVMREDGALVSVSDTGPGVPAEQLPHLFDRFFRGETDRGRQRAQGAGLGLSIVAWIASAHEGRVGAFNRAGGGLRVEVLLPPIGDREPGDAGEADTARTA